MPGTKPNSVGHRVDLLCGTV